MSGFNYCSTSLKFEIANKKYNINSDKSQDWFAEFPF